MTKDEATRIAQTVGRAVDAALGKALGELSSGKASAPVVGAPDGRGAPANASEAAAAFQDFEALYQKIKRRLIDECRVDPVLLHLLTVAPEIVVEVEPRIVTLDGATTKGRIARLMASGWFKDARKSGAVRSELARTGTDPGSGGRLSEALAEYVRDGFLTREGEAYVMAPAVKVTEKTLEVV